MLRSTGEERGHSRVCGKYWGSKHYSRSSFIAFGLNQSNSHPIMITMHGHQNQDVRGLLSMRRSPVLTKHDCCCGVIAGLMDPLPGANGPPRLQVCVTRKNSQIGCTQRRSLAPKLSPLDLR